VKPVGLPGGLLSARVDAVGVEPPPAAVDDAGEPAPPVGETLVGEPAPVDVAAVEPTPFAADCDVAGRVLARLVPEDELPHAAKPSVATSAAKATVNDFSDVNRTGSRIRSPESGQ